MTVFNNY